MMRHFPFLLLFFLWTTYSLNANTLLGCEADNWVKGAERIRTNEKDQSILYLKLSIPEAFSESELPIWLSNIHNASSDDTFKLHKKETDKKGNVHYRFRQYYKGFQVINAVYYIHTFNHKITSANGVYIPGIQSDTQARIKEEDALRIGKEEIPGLYAWKPDEFPTPTQVIHVKDGIPYFTYQVDIYSTKPLRRSYLFIDAVDGSIIESYDRIHHSHAEGIGETRYSGSRPMLTDSLNPSSFRLRDYTRGNGVLTWDMNQSTLYSSAIDFTDADNYWNTTTNKDDVGNDVHWGSLMMHDYLSMVHGRNSYDNSGAAMNSYVHYDNGYNNAFWDGSGFSYGDGDGIERDPYTSIDVVGHEIMHAVTEHSAGLIYSYESGALNESFSDIFGVVQDFRNRPNTANYLIGEEFYYSGIPFRNMSNPQDRFDPDTYLGNFWVSGPTDNGGVHSNSGVQNYWFYLLVNGGSGVNDNGDAYSIQGIGMDAAADIAYRNLTVYLTPSSSFSDARFYAVEAAIDLFGECSDEVINTTNAWYAVGLGAEFSNFVAADLSSSNTFSCTVPAIVQFNNLSTNGNSYFWDFGDGSSSTDINPNHTYLAEGSYSITLITNGNAACGTTDTIVYTDFINVTSNGGPTNSICNASTTQASSNHGIFNVDFLTISNSSQGSNILSYEDFSCTHATNITEGIFYPMSIETGNEEWLRIWCDLNSDGQFNNVNEQIYASPSPASNHNFDLILPAGAIFDTPLRLRVKSDVHEDNLISACQTIQSGQSEDYTVEIAENFSAPLADFAANETNVLLSSVVEFSDLSLNAPNAWSWQFPGGNPSSSTLQNPTVTYNQLGTFPVTLMVSNSDGTHSTTTNDYISVTSVTDFCDQTMTTAVTGTLYDSGGPNGNYSNNEDCEFLIQPLCAQNLTFSFVSIGMESCCDRVRIYDGVNASAPLLLTATGNSVPMSVTSSTGSLFVTFESDGSVTGAGFEANWTSATPTTAPTANFSVSNLNPIFNAPVTFTDQSSEFSATWAWDFGDGNTSTEQNPTHQYVSSGPKDVQLIVGNCFDMDTIVQSLTVQDMPDISLTPASIDLTLDCNENTTVDLVLSNSGSGLGTYSIDFPDAFMSQESQLFFDFTNETTHSFSGVSVNTNAISLEVTLNGDFDDFGENASLFIDGNFIEIIDDGDITNGQDIVTNYTFDAATIAPWIADGEVEVRIQNSASVNLATGGEDYHIVNITFEGVGWISNNNSEGQITAGNTATTTTTLDADGLTEGVYQETIFIQTNNINNAIISLPVTLTVEGEPEIVFDHNCINYINTVQFTTDTMELVISNTGCADLNISDFSAGASEFTTEFSQLSVPAFGTDTMEIYFSPQTVGSFQTLLYFTNNAMFDSLCLTGSSLGAPAIEVDPTDAAINLDLECGQDSSLSITLNNSGLGLGTYDASFTGSFFQDSSEIGYGFTNITTHQFAVSPNANTIELQITLNGDFDDTGEFASFSIDGTFIEMIEDGNVFNGQDIIIDYTFDAATIAPWIADGMIEVEIVNSSIVDAGLGGTDTHKVVLSANGVGWLNISNPNGQVTSNGSTELSINISTENLEQGTYSDIISIQTNNVFNPVLMVPITINVTGQPEISLNVTCLNFPMTVQFTDFTLPLVVNNPGCSPLVISGVNSGDPVFSAALTSLVIPPFTSDTIPVIFAPTTIGTFNSTLTLLNNAGNLDVCVMGASTGAPLIGVDPDAISISLNSCNDTITVPVTVSNIGNNNLIYNFIGNGDSATGSSLDSVLFRLDNSFESITDLVPNLYEFSGGITGTNISDGGGDMYDNGNIIRINSTSSSPVNYTGGTILDDNQLGTDGRYFTRKHPGLFVFAADINNISSFNITGNLGADGSGEVDGSELDYNYQGTNYKGFIKRVYDAFDPSVNHLIIVKEPTSNITQFVPTTTDFDQHYIENIQDVNRIYYLLFAGANSDFISDQEFEAIMIQFLESVESGGLAELPEGNFSLAANNSETFNIPFISNNLPGGTYTNTIIISSNDPTNPSLEIPVSINVSFDLCADFVFSQTQECNGQIDFVSTTVNNPSTYNWDFGDGQTSNSANPTHTYANPGNYQVTLTVTNSTSSDVITYMVNIDNTSGPIEACDVNSNNNFPNGEISLFTLNTINNNSGFNNDSYSDFTCDFSTNLIIGTEYDFSFESQTFFTLDGGIWIDFNNDGSFSSSEMIFSIEDMNPPFSGSFVVPDNATVGVPLRLRVGMEENFYTLDPCEPSIDGEWEDYTVLIESNQLPPMANFEFDILDDCQGVIQFNDNSTNLPDSWFWDFGDGNTSGVQNPIHTFNSAGVYTVTLTATNGFGNNSNTQNITINTLNPSVELSTSTPAIDEPLTFTPIASGAIAWNWDFGDGIQSTLESPTHTYTEVGQYTVTLTVTNGLGCQNTTILVIDVMLTGIEEIIPFVQIYPNPNDGNFTINNTSGLTYHSIEIFNAVGQRVYSERIEIPLEQKEIKLKDFASGIYWVKVHFSDEDVLVKKISIKH